MESKLENITLALISSLAFAMHIAYMTLIFDIQSYVCLCLPSICEKGPKQGGPKMQYFISVQNAFSVLEWVHSFTFNFTLVQPIEKSLCAILVNIHPFNLVSSDSKYIFASRSY